MDKTFRTNPSPLRAERLPDHANTSAHKADQIRAVPASPGGLIKSTLISGAVALSVLGVVYLPAEYGIDPTGLGAVLGLTEMGQIKQQLYAEAEADAAAARVVALDPDALARLDRIEAQLIALSAVIGASSGVVPTQAPPPPPQTASAPEAQTVLQAATTAAPWRDEVSYTLAPGEGIEVKLAMQKGQTAQFEWTANGAVVNYDTHGDGSGQKVSYEQGRAVADQAGELTAAFTGNHGWFWRNRTESPVTVTLRAAGDYAQLRAP